MQDNGAGEWCSEAASLCLSAGSHGPFVQQQSDIPDVVYLKDEQALVIPCRVTAPNTTVGLVKVRT